MLSPHRNRSNSNHINDNDHAHVDNANGNNHNNDDNDSNRNTDTRTTIVRVSALARVIVIVMVVMILMIPGTGPKFRSLCVTRQELRGGAQHALEAENADGGVVQRQGPRLRRRRHRERGAGRPQDPDALRLGARAEPHLGGEGSPRVGRGLLPYCQVAPRPQVGQPLAQGGAKRERLRSRRLHRVAQQSFREPVGGARIGTGVGEMYPLVLADLLQGLATKHQTRDPEARPAEALEGPQAG